MSKYENTKNVVEGVIAASVGLVIQTVISNNTPPGLKLLPRIGMRIGTIAIGSILSGMASKKVTDGMDDLVLGVQKGVEAAEAEAKAAQELLNEHKAKQEARETEAKPKPQRKPAAKKIDTTLPNPTDV